MHVNKTMKSARACLHSVEIRGLHIDSEIKCKYVCLFFNAYSFLFLFFFTSKEKNVNQRVILFLCPNLMFSYFMDDHHLFRFTV